MNEQTSDPMMAGATLSGCPSISVAMATASSRRMMRPVSDAAPMMPATVHADDDPRPRAMGIGQSISIAMGKGSSPQCARARANER